MYHHIEGELVVLGPSRAVVDTGGVGYECRIPLSTYTVLKGKERTRVRLLTHLHVLEDDLRLYGFATESERDLFRVASSIGGVGPTIALAALASFDPAGFAAAISSGDSRSLQKIKGVGPKLSERMVLELRDAPAIAALAQGAPSGGAASKAGVREEVLSDAAALLVELGFGSREAKAKVEAVVARLLKQEGGDAGGGAGAAAITVEAIVQAALRNR
jgi:Holliday junction DNA helicase RuvA